MNSKLYAINMASCPGLQAQGGILAYPHRVRRLSLFFPRFPSPTQTALETMRVCNTDRRAPPPRFPKPLWNSNEALFLSNPLPVGIHSFFPAPKVSCLLHHWNYIYCGPRKPPLPISSSNIFCLLLIHCSSLCTAEKRWRRNWGGIISQVLFL